MKTQYCNPIYTDKIQLAKPWIMPLIYGDYSGLSEPESDIFDQWLKNYCEGFYYTFNVSKDTELNIDLITGLLSDCYTVQVFIV